MVETSAFLRMIELPPDMSLVELTARFPPGEFRLVYKPDGVIRIQRVNAETGSLKTVAGAIVGKSTTTT